MISINKIYWKKTLINTDATIYNAAKNLNSSGLRIVLVVSKKNKLIGTISDGDIRRALIKGKNFKNSIKSILKTNPVCADFNSSENTLRKLMKQNSVLQIPLIDKKGIIAGLYMLKEYEQKIKRKHKNKIVIMAGGLGQRLGSLTRRTPKPMLKISGKPILEHIIETLSLQGFNNIFISVFYKKEIIKKYFRKQKFFNSKIRFIEEKKPLGTAGALSLLKGTNKNPLLVINGDLLFDFDLENLIKFHKKCKADSTILVKTHAIQNPFGVVKSKKNLVLEFNEKPTYYSHINTGIYALNPSVLKLIQKNKKISMVDFLKKIISKNKKVYALSTSDSWNDLGSLKQFSRYI